MYFSGVVINVSPDRFREFINMYHEFITVPNSPVTVEYMIYFARHNIGLEDCNNLDDVRFYIDQYENDDN
jgi:hypothetical protein